MRVDPHEKLVCKKQLPNKTDLHENLVCKVQLPNKTDPRVKLLLIVVLTTLAVLSKDIGYLSIVVAVTIVAALCFKVDVINAILRLKHFLWLVLFIGFVQSLTIKGGVVLISIGNVSLLTTRGIQFAIEFICRMSVIVFAGAIAASSKGNEMMDGLQTMKMPYELVFMASIALRFLPLFREEFSGRMNAIAIRGIEIKQLSLCRKIKVYAYLISPTISGSILRSEELSRAMDARGFRAYRKRTMLRTLKLSTSDIVLMAVVVTFAIAFLACMYTFGMIVQF